MLWLAVVVGAAALVGGSGTVAYGLLIAGVSFLLAPALLLPGRRVRIREEGEDDPDRR